MTSLNGYRATLPLAPGVGLALERALNDAGQIESEQVSDSEIVTLMLRAGAESDEVSARWGFLKFLSVEQLFPAHARNLQQRTVGDVFGALQRQSEAEHDDDEEEEAWPVDESTPIASELAFQEKVNAVARIFLDAFNRSN